MLQALQLECVRGERVLFRALSFGLRGGELLRIAGANGSGKTSLLRILCGLLSPHGGEVQWAGTPIQRLREDYARQLVYLGHAPAVKEELTAAENLAISCRLAGAPFSARSIGEALARFGLPEDRRLPVRKLSQGQKRRAALARLCLSEAAPLWLLDEPFTALDAVAIELMKELIDRHVRRGSMVAYTTHQDPGIAPTRVLELG